MEKINTNHIKTPSELETFNLLHAKAQIQAFREKINQLNNDDSMTIYMNNFQTEVDLLEQKLKSDADQIHPQNLKNSNILHPSFF